MEIAEDLARLYQQLATASRAKMQNQPDAGEQAEELLAQAEARVVAARAPETRSDYEALLAAAGVALDQPARAVAALEASEQRFPREAGPSLQLAQVYMRVGRFDEALEACELAMGKSAGAAALAVYSTREQIHRLKGDECAADQTRAEAQQIAATMPAPVPGTMTSRR
jgi:tetratricopeptide (TPR) repeat protein